MGFIVNKSQKAPFMMYALVGLELVFADPPIVMEFLRTTAVPPVASEWYRVIEDRYKRFMTPVLSMPHLISTISNS